MPKRVDLIAELTAERDRLTAMRDRLTSTIARLCAEAEIPRETYIGRRRGRKYMSKEERQRVSERMRNYWAEKRKADGPPILIPIGRIKLMKYPSSNQGEK